MLTFARNYVNYVTFRREVRPRRPLAVFVAGVLNAVVCVCKFATRAALSTRARSRPHSIRINTRVCCEPNFKFRRTHAQTILFFVQFHWNYNCVTCNYNNNLYCVIRGLTGRARSGVTLLTFSGGRVRMYCYERRRVSLFYLFVKSIRAFDWRTYEHLPGWNVYGIRFQIVVVIESLIVEQAWCVMILYGPLEFPVN